MNSVSIPGSDPYKPCVYFINQFRQDPNQYIDLTNSINHKVNSFILLISGRWHITGVETSAFSTAHKVTIAKSVQVLVHAPLHAIEGYAFVIHGRFSAVRIINCSSPTCMYQIFVIPLVSHNKVD